MDQERIHQFINAVTAGMQQQISTAIANAMAPLQDQVSGLEQRITILSSPDMSAPSRREAIATYPARGMAKIREFELDEAGREFGDNRKFSGWGLLTLFRLLPRPRFNIWFQ